ncbi:Hint domain-containing protein [Cellulomonas palmilytica]|uniref:Hint domain-containing protein n=1 Tax=Cellulomonas palmilytica TaxID=2608402 RepID=UPI001F47D23B|nr:Hint domain-containing protein [Cellulomonas palmilytica]UJP40227.1 hypothetical protein F1D97_01395 [Cellulomonas palmilytica]
MGAAKRAPRRRVTGAIVAAALAGGVAVGVVAASREPSIEAQRCAAGEAPTVAEAVVPGTGVLRVAAPVTPITFSRASRGRAVTFETEAGDVALTVPVSLGAPRVDGTHVVYPLLAATGQPVDGPVLTVEVHADGSGVTPAIELRDREAYEQVRAAAGADGLGFEAFSWRSLAFDSVVGGASGLLGAGLGKAAAKFAAPAARRLGSSLSSAVKSVSAKTSSAAAPAARSAAKAGSAAKAKPSGSSPRVPEGAACRLSFSGDTRVLLASGASVRIDELKVGDEVMAADPQAGEKRGEQVEAVHEHQDALIVLVIDGAQLRTTEDHPFWSVSDQRYERADHLSPGELVLTSDGRTATVDAVVDDEPLLAPAYTLTVSDLHTYFVLTSTPTTTDPARGPPASSTAILVHNCDVAANTVARLEPSVGQKVFRVYGGDSKAGGASWSPVDPRSVGNYRDAAGLPSGGASGATNTGQFVIEGTLNDPAAVVLQRSALPLDGMKVGVPEYIVPNWLENGSITINRVSGVNPGF